MIMYTNLIVTISDVSNNELLNIVFTVCACNGNWHLVLLQCVRLLFFIQEFQF